MCLVLRRRELIHWWRGLINYSWEPTRNGRSGSGGCDSMSVGTDPLMYEDPATQREGYLPANHTTTLGAIDGGSPCRLSILKSSNVACLWCYIISMSLVKLKKWSCRMSLWFLSPCRVAKAPCRMSNLRNISVALSLRPAKAPWRVLNLKKWPCSRVNFKGLGPYPLPGRAGNNN